ncbi:unnamed protein product [Gadus morhua 'NCC']
MINYPIAPAASLANVDDSALALSVASARAIHHHPLNPTITPTTTTTTTTITNSPIPWQLEPQSRRGRGTWISLAQLVVDDQRAANDPPRREVEEVKEVEVREEVVELER